jgi:hypothetical protein
MLDTDEAVRVANGYRRQLHALTVRSGRFAVQSWIAAAGNEEEWLHAAAIAARATRRQAAATAVAMHASMLGDTVDVDLDEIVGTVLAAFWSHPLVMLQQDLALGATFAEALYGSRRRAASAVASEVTSAARETSMVIARAEPRIVGYRRTLSPRACRWCATIATQRYRSAETASAPDHDGKCGCSVVPITLAADPGRVINRPLLDALKGSDSAYVTATVRRPNGPTPPPAPHRGHNTTRHGRHAMPDDSTPEAGTPDTAATEDPKVP